eukprot:3394071-Lingulodinium_polyedra.AAC.1
MATNFRRLASAGCFMQNSASIVLGLTPHFSRATRSNFLGVHRGASLHPTPNFKQWRTAAHGPKPS